MKEATSRRNDLLHFLKGQGVQYLQNNLSKPYLNNLSPGCWTCVEGTWSCVQINSLCTRDCFYCPRNKARETIPEADGFRFARTELYIDHLKKFNYQGIGFSGGEPFVVFERLLTDLRRIREVFGRRHYLWVYTNGDLVTGERLRALNQIGLNELRFDISARGYNLKPVQLAVRHIDTVTVEIPAIPEDVQRVKPLIKRLEAIGVKFLNIHQLHSSRHNQRALMERGYTFLNSDYFSGQSPILESEWAALEILEHALCKGTGMGIHYCSFCYKGRFQGMAFRKRYCPLVKKNNETITETGFIRSLVSSPEKSMEASTSKDLLYSSDQKDDGSDWRVNYYSVKNNRRTLVRSIDLRNETSVTLFKKLFLKHKNRPQVLREFSRKYRLTRREMPHVLEDIESFYRAFGDLEYISEEMPDYRQTQ
jgi:pyruvate formate-lyase activating enzyme-like uncharacterized protein